MIDVLDPTLPRIVRLALIVLQSEPALDDRRKLAEEVLADYNRNPDGTKKVIGPR